MACILMKNVFTRLWKKEKNVYFQKKNVPLKFLKNKFILNAMIVATVNKTFQSELSLGCTANVLSAEITETNACKPSPKTTSSNFNR